MTTNNNIIEQAIAHFPNAKSVLFTADVAALNKQQNVETAAAYSFWKYGADVVNTCRDSFVASGYGTAGDFYTLLCDLRDGKA